MKKEVQLFKIDFFLSILGYIKNSLHGDTQRSENEWHLIEWTKEVSMYKISKNHEKILTRVKITGVWFLSTNNIFSKFSTGHNTLLMGSLFSKSRDSELSKNV